MCILVQYYTTSLCKTMHLNSSYLVFCYFQQVSDLLSHLLSCLHLELPGLEYFNCPQYLPSIISCNNSSPFSYPSSLVCHFPFYNVVEKILRPVNMPKPCCQCFQCQIVFNVLLVSVACTNTSSFVTCYVQLSFIIICHIHISNASSSFYVL